MEPVCGRSWHAVGGWSHVSSAEKSRRLHAFKTWSDTALDFAGMISDEVKHDNGSRVFRGSFFNRFGAMLGPKVTQKEKELRNSIFQTVVHKKIETVIGSSTIMHVNIDGTISGEVKHDISSRVFHGIAIWFL